MVVLVIKPGTHFKREVELDDWGAAADDASLLPYVEFESQRWTAALTRWWTRFGHTAVSVCFDEVNFNNTTMTSLLKVDSSMETLEIIRPTHLRWHPFRFPSKLRSLTLVGCALDEHEYRWIADAIAASQIETLCITGINQLDEAGELLVRLPEVRSLRHLSLAFVHRLHELNELVRVFQPPGQLTKLSLGHMSVYPREIRAIGSYGFECLELTMLDPFVLEIMFKCFFPRLRVLRLFGAHVPLSPGFARLMNQIEKLSLTMGLFDTPELPLFAIVHSPTLNRLRLTESTLDVNAFLNQCLEAHKFFSKLVLQVTDSSSGELIADYLELNPHLSKLRIPQSHDVEINIRILQAVAVHPALTTFEMYALHPDRQYAPLYAAVADLIRHNTVLKDLTLPLFTREKRDWAPVLEQFIYNTTLEKLEIPLVFDNTQWTDDLFRAFYINRTLQQLQVEHIAQDVFAALAPHVQTILCEI